MREGSQDLGFQQRADTAATLSQSPRRLGPAETRPSRLARPPEDLNGLALLPPQPGGGGRWQEPHFIGDGM